MRLPIEPRGAVLTELLVASACAALLAAAVLSLMINAGWIGRRTLLRIEAGALARACVGAVARDIGRAGSGLEGAASVVVGAETVPVLTLARGRVALWVPDGDSAEVEEAGAAEYRVAAAGFAADTRVVGIGVREAPVSGLVTRAWGRGAWRRVRVAWSAPVEEVRALQPSRYREYELRADDSGAVRLARRDDSGRWLPVVDGIERLQVDERAVERPAPGAEAAPTRIEVACVAVAGAERRRSSARIGGRAP